MSILNDIRTAAIAAVTTQVTSTISTVTADVPVAISPNEEFTFNVTAANTGADAIGLTNVAYHLTVPALPAILKLKVPPSPPARATNDPTAPTLAPGTFVTGMFLFPTDNKLTIGDSDTISGLKGKALALGNASISMHVHADPDLDNLFPKSTGGVSGTRNVVVI
jgi:hypothetical protein